MTWRSPNLDLIDGADAYGEAMRWAPQGGAPIGVEQIARIFAVPESMLMAGVMPLAPRRRWLSWHRLIGRGR